MFSVSVGFAHRSGQVTIRNPEIVIEVLRPLLKSVSRVYWDNELGHGSDFEGRVLLKQFVQECEIAKEFPEVVITAVGVAARREMELTLQEAGYVLNGSTWSK